MILAKIKKIKKMHSIYYYMHEEKQVHILMDWKKQKWLQTFLERKI